MNRLSLEGKVRADILTAAHNTGKVGAHIAPSLSIVEISLAVLSSMDNERDLFILSKGHGALGYYSAMNQMNVITDEQFGSFEDNGGEFPGQPSRTKNNHIDYSGGSLGMGLSYATGRACADARSKVYVVLGDGELDEGSNWEAAQLASRLKLSNLIAIVDCNGLQSDGRCEDILGKNINSMWEACGWEVIRADGHNTEQLINIIKENNENVINKPLVILAKTIKGKGVSFMESNNEWHHHSLDDKQYDMAISEIGEKYGIS